MIFWMMVAAHFLADFTLQSTKMAKRKQESMLFLLMHVAIYTVVMGLFTGVCVEYRKLTEPLLLFAATHFLADGLKISIDKSVRQRKWEFLSFVIDQMFHLLVIAYVVWYYKLEWYQSALWGRLLEWEQLELAMLFGVTFLILGDPVSVFINKLFLYLFDSFEEKQYDKARPDTGSVIGKLERLIVALLVLANQWGAIGFVLTAKSIARYKQIGEDKDDFAEKYLIGTLASAAIAIALPFLLLQFM